VIVTIEFYDEDVTYDNITPQDIEISDLVVPGENDADRLTHEGWKPDNWKQKLLKSIAKE
jgi:predicted HAD superfamily Cof-like phosphohydrolase